VRGASTIDPPPEPGVPLAGTCRLDAPDRVVHHDPAPRPDEGELMSYDESGDGRFDPLTAVRRRWWVVVLLAVLGALALGGASAARSPVYTSTANVQWQSGGGQMLPGAQVDRPTGDDAQRALSTQSDVILGDEVMQAAATTVGNVSLKDLRKDASVDVATSSNVLDIAVSGPDAAAAQARAVAVVNSYVAQSKARGVASITSQADALQTPIDQLTTQLTALNAANPTPTLTPGAAAVRIEDPTVTAQRAALIGQLSDLQRQQSEYRTAAGVYQGEATVLAAPDLPEAPSSLTAPRGAVLGAALGLALGLLIAVLLGARAPKRRVAPAAPVDDRSAQVTAPAATPSSTQTSTPASTPSSTQTTTPASTQTTTPASTQGPSARVAAATAPVTPVSTAPAGAHAKPAEAV
jgi:uncharacterized protein involved in exopolysaccharide biosynthesis